MLCLALLLTVLSCTAQDRSAPVIKLNSTVLKESEVALLSGTPFTLSCEGNGSVTWKTRLAQHRKHVSKNEFTVKQPTAEYTGTYKCFYKSPPDLYSEIHVYVRDPVQLFTTPRTSAVVEKEGSDCLLACLLTDPGATDFSLRMDNGSAVPLGMNYTADPKRGISIQGLLPSYSDDYVCSARIQGVERVSTRFSINVRMRLHSPPYVSLEEYEYVRIVGEMLQIPCTTTNPDHAYSITWKHSSNKTLSFEEVSKSSPLKITSVLTIPAVTMSDAGNLTCIGKNVAGENSSTTYLQVVDKPYIRLSPHLPTKLNEGDTDIEVKEGENLDLNVLIEAYPEIKEKWWDTPMSHNTSTQEETFHRSYNRYKATLLLKRVRPEERGLYILHTRSRTANASISFNVQVYHLDAPATSSEVWLSEIFTPALVGAASVAALLLLLLIIVFYKYKQKPKYEIRWKIIEASDGNNYSFVDPTHLPYNENWEFPRDKLRLGQILGAGAFGKVVEAIAYGLGADNITQVAVKMLKPSAHSEEREALMCELKILSHLGPHENIVNLLGACTQGGPMLMITEYCCHGDLLNFLRSEAEMFVKSMLSMSLSVSEEAGVYKNLCVQGTRVRSDSGISCSGSDNYQDMQSGLKPKLCTQDDEAEVGLWELDTDDLLRFSYEVAQGMDFLASRNCIHRDLAARNVLLTDCHVAKICDFGLARDIMNDSNYVVKGNARLPVKWMSPESIFDCVYTVQSDVWSYGVLLWEIFSLGKSPYPDVMVDHRFYKMIKDGYHMSRPDFAPPELYTIMKMCWNLEPTLRPTFSKLGQLIEKLLPEQPDQNVQHEPERQEQQQTEISPKACDESCDQISHHEEEEEPLMKTNNYQFC